LVVDDEEGVRRTLERSLSRLGYEFLEAENGEVGLQMAEQHKPQVILLDIRMPRMDGHALLGELASRGLDAAVVVMSAHGTMQDVISVLRKGAVDYLKKPWEASELVSAVSRAVEIHDQRATLRGKGAPAADAGAVAAKPGGASAMGTILDQLRRGEIPIPPLSTVLAELRTLMANPDTPIQQITALVERDPRLVVQTLRIANSALYSRGSRINDLRTAVGRIGLRQLSNLIHTVTVSQSNQVQDPSLRLVQARIWRYSIARAVSMRALAELANSGAALDPETAYLAGLLADTGAAFLASVIAERAVLAKQPVDLEAGLAGIRAQHEEVGQMLLSEWEIDQQVASVARFHHSESPPAPPNPYWSLAVLGTNMANSLEAGEDSTSTAPPNPALVDRCAAELRVSSTVGDKISESVRNEFDEIMEALA